MSISNVSTVHPGSACPDSLPGGAASMSRSGSRQLYRYLSVAPEYYRARIETWFGTGDKLAWFAGLYVLSVLAFGSLVGCVRWTLAAM